MNTPGVGSPVPARTAARPLVRLAWDMAIAAGVVLLAGGIVVAAALGQPPVPHPVLDARFSTASFLPGGAVERTSYDLWIDPTMSRARLDSTQAWRDLYYERDGSGAWYSTGRVSSNGRWQRARLSPDQAPSLLSESGMHAYFARLRALAGPRGVTRVDLHHRLAYAFPAVALAWPYHNAGVTTVWLDGATGLPLQLRDIAVEGKSLVTVITRVDSLRAISSARQSAGFFTPPNQRLAPWQDVWQRVTAWIAARLHVVRH